MVASVFRLGALALGATLAFAQMAPANAQCFRQSNARLPSMESVSQFLTNGEAGQSIYRATTQGDVAAVQSLLATDGRLLATRTVLPEGTRPNNGNSADLLTAAIAACDLSMVQALLGFGANANGEIPGLALTYAVLADDPAYATALLDAGADPDRHDPGLSSPLREAIMFERADAVALLAARGANVNASDAFGRTPLGSALNTQEWPVIMALFEAGANPWQVHNQGVLPAYTIYANEPRRRADRRIRNALLEQIAANNPPIWPPVHAGEVMARVGAGEWPTSAMRQAGFVVTDGAMRAMQAASR